ncbi:urease accessory protein [Bifidobacterium sp. DSM 109958]|uniref:Urease accessory protein UreD n=1 Tax=Bifidobacterium moraviense TaxID=2675323 RepID=A0A7Y0F305_9BIFI|nr:urease accessory protein UreD [Bifidobacterium sp. DSM 109958]NMN01078.1 urease accessory protein [Bifidobacterium sp. DSM 109958]
MASSTFRLTTAFRHGRTKIDDVYFEAPFKLMTPFANGRHSDFIVMLASPGFLKGDEAHIAIDFAPGTDSTIRTQSYEKVLDTADGAASRTIDLTARGDAKAVFLPFPVIPFRGSTFMNQTTARISAASTFVYGDVVTCGRVGMGERWAMRRFANRMRVFVDDRLAFADRLLLEPDAFDYTELGMWREFTHCGVAYAHLPETDPADSADHADSTAPTDPAAREADRVAARIAAEDALIERIRDHARAIGFTGELGVSRAVSGVCVRLLTTRGDDAFDFIRDVADMV